MRDMPMSDPLTLTLRGIPIKMSLDEWEDVSRTVMAHVLERDRRVEEAQRAAGQVWHAIYYCYGARIEDEHFSFEDAASALRTGWEMGTLSDVGIRLPDGRLIESDFGIAVDPDAVKAALNE